MTHKFLSVKSKMQSKTLVILFTQAQQVLLPPEVCTTPEQRVISSGDSWLQTLGGHCRPVSNSWWPIRTPTRTPMPWSKINISSAIWFALIIHISPKCFKTLDISEDSYRCTKCNYPMCNAACENGQIHSNYECKLFRTSGYKAPSFGSVEEYRDLQFNPYCFITTLRCLLMKGKLGIVILSN